MRFLLLVLLLGIALAKPVHDALEVEEEEVLSLLEHQYLEELLALSDADEDGDDGGPQTELGKKLKEHLDELLEKIKDSIDQGKVVKQGLVDKVKEIREKLKEMKIDMGKKAKEVLERITELWKKNWQKLLDILTGKNDGKEFKRDADGDGESEMAKNLKEYLVKVLDKIKENIDNGKVLKDELLDKLKNVIQEMKKKGIEFDGKVKELLQKIKEKAKDLYEKFLEKLKDVKKRSIGERVRENIVTLREMLNNGGISLDEIGKKAEELFGRFSELTRQIKDIIKKKGEQARDFLLSLLDKLLGKKEERAVREWWEKMKEYFKEFKIDLKEKFSKFGEWIKDNAGKVLDKTKSKVENIKEMAKEMMKHAKDLNKEIAGEALEFFRQSKEDIGDLWDDVKNSLKEILQRKD